MRTTPLRGWIACSALFTAMIVGCKGTALAPTPADRLREQVQTLETQVAMLEGRNRELEAAIADRGSDSVTSPADLDAEAELARPRLARIQIGPATRIELVPADATREAMSGTLFLSMDPSDGRGRFMQVVGRASVQVSIPVEGSSPIVVGERSFSPGEIRDCWRSGFMGTHYTLEVPVQIPSAVLEEDSALEASVLLVFRDALGGGVYSRLVAVPIDRGAPTEAPAATGNGGR